MNRSVFARVCILGSLLAGLAACSESSTDPAAGTGGGAGVAGMGGASGAPGVAGAGAGGGGGASACPAQSYAEEAMTSGAALFNGVTLSTSTPIADIVADPAKFEGQVVRVEGFIVTICQDAGCYVTLESPTKEQINLKVTDGAIDFRTVSALGNYAIGEGVSQQAGEHGAQVFIQEHGGVIGTLVCSEYTAP